MIKNDINISTIQLHNYKIKHEKNAHTFTIHNITLFMEVNDIVNDSQN